MQTFSANQAKTQFGHFIDLAQREPVRVMRRDRVVGVMVSAQDYEAMRAFCDLLFEAGYHEPHAELYLRFFQLVEMRVIEVGEGFPRLTIGTVPTGITRAQYEIDLDKAPAQPVALVAAMKALGAI